MEELEQNAQGDSPRPEAGAEQGDADGTPVAAAEASPEAVDEQAVEPEGEPTADAGGGEGQSHVTESAVAAGDERAVEPEGEPAVDATAGEEQATSPEPAFSVDELMQSQPAEEAAAPAPQQDVQLMAVLEAVIYVAEEPLTAAQIAASLGEPEERIRALLDQLMAEFETAGHGVCIREIAGGFKMATKPEHHDAVRNFVKSLKPPLKLSLPALETLAVIAYKQPVTGPEIMEIRGVQGGGVIKTLLDRKLIAVAGRKNVIGKPILYKTTKEFLIQFGLKDLSELPSLKEFEEIRRMAFDGDAPAGAETPAAAAGDEAAVPAEPVPQAEADRPAEDAVAAEEPEAADEPGAGPAASEES